MNTLNPETVLFYDGDCGFCCAYVRKARKLGVQCSMIPYQSVDLEYYQLTQQECSESVQLWEKLSSGELSKYNEAKAVGIVLQKYSNKKTSRLLGSFIIFPPLLPLSNFIYRKIAKNRNKLAPTQNSSCTIHP